jgi:hypothetical protein
MHAGHFGHYLPHGVGYYVSIYVVHYNQAVLFAGHNGSAYYFGQLMYVGTAMLAYYRYIAGVGYFRDKGVGCKLLSSCVQAQKAYGKNS